MISGYEGQPTDKAYVEQPTTKVYFFVVSSSWTSAMEDINQLLKRVGGTTLSLSVTPRSTDDYPVIVVAIRGFHDE